MSATDLSFYDHKFKVITLGESQVGKSSLILRYCDAALPKRMEMTIGSTLLHTIQSSSLYPRSSRESPSCPTITCDARRRAVDFRHKDVNIAGQRVRLQIWDTAGQVVVWALRVQRVILLVL